MRLFAKSVTDPEVCFCQNVVELLSGLSKVTTSVAWIAITQRVLKERNLWGIIEKHADNLAGYIVRECYPSDRSVLMNHAEALFEIATAESMWKQHPDIMVQLSKVIRKMGLLRHYYTDIAWHKRMVLRSLLGNTDTEIGGTIK